MRNEVRFTIPNKQGTFKLLPKTRIGIDEAKYQRLNPRTVKRIIREGWNWPKAGTLSVSERPDKSHWVYDGGGRLRAALEIQEIENLPCMVYKTTNIARAEEAGTFKESGTDRTRLTGYDKHRASVVAGNSVSIFVDKLINRASAVKAGAQRHADWMTKECETEEGRNAISSIWPALIEAYAGVRIDGRVLRGLTYIQRNLEGATLATKNWQETIVEIGAIELDRHARGGTVLGKNSAPYWARGLIERLNQRKKRRLKMIQQ